MEKLIYLFILLFFAQTICAQSISNSLFLVVDKQTDSIKVSSKDYINFKYYHFNYKELAQFFSKHYSYYYEYLQKSRKRTYKRYNVFIIFKSDLNKTFVPCYEMTLLKSRITEI